MKEYSGPIVAAFIIIAVVILIGYALQKERVEPVRIYSTTPASITGADQPIKEHLSLDYCSMMVNGVQIRWYPEGKSYITGELGRCVNPFTKGK